MQRLAGVFSVLHGLRKSKGEDVKETEQPKSVMPSREQVLDVFQKLKLSLAGRIRCTPSDMPAVMVLEKAGLIKLERGYCLNPETGVIEQRTSAVWIGGWNCENCSEFFIGDMTEKTGNLGRTVTFKNVPQCKKGFSMEFRDSRKGRRCPFYRDKRLMEALNGVTY